MFKKIFVVAILFILLAVAVMPAAAITGKYEKDFDHPFVGLAVFYDANGEFSHRCSGSLLSPTVFLTAGHCVDGVISARIYFQQDAGAHYDPLTELDPVTGYPDYCAAGTEGVVCATSDQLESFDYSGVLPNTHDAGMVILDQSIDLLEYGELPDAGFLDKLATQRGLQDLTFTDSGYGLSYTNPKFTASYRERLMAQSKLVNLRSALTDGYNLQTSNNPGIGGGTCFGDSGGPIFYGDNESNLIVGITSFGMNANVCAGVDFAYRVDQAALLEWIEGFLH